MTDSVAEASSHPNFIQRVRSSIFHRQPIAEPEPVTTPEITPEPIEGLNTFINPKSDIWKDNRAEVYAVYKDGQFTFTTSRAGSDFRIGLISSNLNVLGNQFRDRKLIPPFLIESVKPESLISPEVLAEVQNKALAHNTYFVLEYRGKIDPELLPPTPIMPSQEQLQQLTKPLPA